MDINIKWFSANNIKKNHEHLKVKQVYVWIVSTDNKYVIVSKDGHKWQLPGGKPDDKDTSLLESAVREVREETGLNIQKHVNKLTFFGYYKVTEKEHAKEEQYLQVRMILHINKHSSSLDFNIQEDVHQNKSDIIHHVKIVPLDYMVKLIKWLPSSGEFKELGTKKFFKT